MQNQKLSCRMAYKPGHDSISAKRPYQSDINDILIVEIGSNRWQASTDEIRLVRLQPMHLLAILLRVD